MPDAVKAVNVDRLDLFAPIVKVEASETLAADGLPEHVIVKGICTGPDVDIDGQRMDSQWLRTELPAWFTEWGNIRAMHKPDAVGVAQELQEQEDGDWHLTAKIVDRDAVRKVTEKVYKGFSIGIKSPVLAMDTLAPKGRYVGGKVIETSLVDRPAYSAAKFDSIEQPVLAAKFVLGQAVGPGEWRDTQTGITLSKAAGEPAASIMPQSTKQEGGSPVADLSFEQIRDKVNQALRPKTDDGPWIYVMDTYPSYVITNEGDKYFKVSYSINVDGTVAIGEKTEVVRTYSEVAKAAALELAKKAADEADDEEGKEGDDTCSHCGGEMADGKCKGCDKSADECTCEKQDGKEANPDDEEGKAGEGEPDGDEGKGAKKGARASKGKAADMGAAGDQGLGSRTSMNFSGVGHDILKPVQDLVAAFSAQVDSALKQINEAVRQAQASIPATGHGGTFDPNNPSVKASLTEIVKTVLAGELSNLASDGEFAGKVVGAESAKAVLADAVKGLIDQAVGGIDQRLQVVEQAAAPARGGLIEFERSYAGMQQAGATPDVLKAATTLVQHQNDNSEAAQLARATAMMTLTQTLVRPAQS
jgi:hypothetical protein